MDDSYRPGVEIRRDGVAVGLIAAMTLLGLVVWPHLPARVPTHWNAAGQVNGWSSPAFAVFFAPAMATAIWLLLLCIPVIDPRRRNYAQFTTTYRFIRWAAVALLAVVHTFTLGHALGHTVSVSAVMPVLLAALLLVLGNLMPRIRPNWFAGIRTPWTLSSDETWRRTHRFGGRLMMLGAVLPLVGLLGGSRLLVPLALVGALAPFLAAAVYSYAVYQGLERGRRS